MFRYTLSHRFQLRENSRTCSFLVSLHSLICISFITICFVDVAVTDLGQTDDAYELLFRKVCIFAAFCVLRYKSCGIRKICNADKEG